MVIMYELQHNGDIRPIMNDEQKECVLQGSSVAAAVSSRRVHLTIEDWRRFLADRDRDRTALPDSPILASWQRCLDQGVDPMMANCTAFVPLAQIEEQAALLKDLGHEVERTVYAAIRHRDLLMTVSDAQGRLLRTIGNKKILQQADSLRFGPGAVWAEGSVGTNAISLALGTQMPWQICGVEHFCISHHAWTCSATPIFTPLGSLWGCLDISGHVSSNHSQALWLTMMAVRETERLLFNASLDSMGELSRDMFRAIVGSVPVGLCLVNDQGRITFANPLAEHLLGTSSALRGARAGEYFDFTGIDLAAENSQQALLCPRRPDLFAELAPFVSTNHRRHYLIALHCERPHSDLFVLPGAGADTGSGGPDAAAGRTAGARRHAGTPSSSGRAQDADDPFAEILCRSTVMQAVVERARTMAASFAPILLLGETGTGKELFARALHKASARADQPFVAVNCGALPRDLIQSELFGFEKGSFTGASKSTRGKFEQAHGGTLFLDEISEMPLDMQVNLLRPLETGTVTRVGGSQPIVTDFRLITATNRNLEDLIAKQLFREDLFYRIHVLTLELPPLRERTGDVTLIARTYGQKLARKHNLSYAGFSQEALSCLEAYDWPGNVRQLVHSIEYAVNMAMGSCIEMEHLPKALWGQQGAERAKASIESPGSTGNSAPADFSLDNMERRTIMAALEHYGGNILKAARALGIGRNTLYAKMRKYNIS